MARYLGPVCRLCRREGAKLHLKGERCDSLRCAIERERPQPGVHTRWSMKFSEYKLRLREKQKMRRYYGLLEKQFRHYFRVADKKKGITGVNLLVSLERRLDNVVFRLGFAASRRQARQLVRHSHFQVNGRKANLPSIPLQEGDVISVKDKSRNVQCIKDSMESVMRRGIPGWLELDPSQMKGRVVSLPARDDVDMEFNERLIVELYSR